MEPGLLIDPDAPLAEQIKALEALIGGPLGAAHWITHTPKLAQHVLNTRNLGNRPFKPSRIKRYAGAMANPGWSENGDSIKYGRSGQLRDGQNRLAACSRSGKRFTSLVVFGVDDGAFAVTDVGKPRNGADVLHIIGKSNPISRASAVRWHMIFTSSKPAQSGQDFPLTEILAAQAAIDADSAELFEGALKTAGEIHKLHPVMAVGSLAALLFIYRRANSEAVDEFAHDVFNSRGIGQKLVTWLEQRAANNYGRLHALPRNANTVLALNAYCSGKRLARDWKAWDALARFPTIPKPK